MPTLSQVCFSLKSKASDLLEDAMMEEAFPALRKPQAPLLEKCLQILPRHRSIADASPVCGREVRRMLVHPVYSIAVPSPDTGRTISGPFMSAIENELTRPIK